MTSSRTLLSSQHQGVSPDVHRNVALQAPVTVLTSYLGSGKTTLLNRILTETEAIATQSSPIRRGGMDNDLIVNSDEEILGMPRLTASCVLAEAIARPHSAAVRTIVATGRALRATYD